MMMNQERGSIRLHVIINEYDEAVGIYEPDELDEFVHDYTKDLMYEIDSNYTVEERLEYHTEFLGKMATIVNDWHFEEQELVNYIEYYNYIAPVKISYEVVEVEDEVEMQNTIEYINQTNEGWKKFKENGYEIKINAFRIKVPSKEDTNAILNIESDQRYLKGTMNIMFEIAVKDFQYNCPTDEILNGNAKYLEKVVELHEKVVRGQSYTMQTIEQIIDIYNDYCKKDKEHIEIIMLEQ